MNLPSNEMILERARQASKDLRKRFREDLEQEPCRYWQNGKCNGNTEVCEDAISRQAVLNTLDRMDKALDTDRTVESYKELLTECYKVLPPVKQEPKEGHWIDVKDRVPEENGEYLITWTGVLGTNSTKRSKPLISIAEYEIYEPENYADWITTMDDFEYYHDIKVLAWMPLPEPYEPQESEDKECI